MTEQPPKPRPDKDHSEPLASSDVHGARGGNEPSGKPPGGAGGDDGCETSRRDDDDRSDRDEDDEDEDDDEDEEPRLKYARLTQNLSAVYRNGDATSAFLVAGDKMVRHMWCRIG